jgi:hypothetical protein
MKYWLAALLIAGFVAGGCASKPSQAMFSSEPTEIARPAAPVKSTPAAAESVTKKSEAKSKLIVTPENLTVGIVATYNAAGRFVVLDFPVGKMPVLNQTMFVYRQGLKIGEVKITGPERDHNTVADLISGEAQKGDEVRDK